MAFDNCEISGRFFWFYFWDFTPTVLREALGVAVAGRHLPAVPWLLLERAGCSERPSGLARGVPDGRVAPLDHTDQTLL